MGSKLVSPVCVHHGHPPTDSATHNSQLGIAPGLTGVTPPADVEGNYDGARASAKPDQHPEVLAASGHANSDTAQATDFDKTKMVEFAYKKAQSTFTGKCRTYVELAIDHALPKGKKVPRPTDPSAAAFGPSLQSIGFAQVGGITPVSEAAKTNFQYGDIVVFEKVLDNEGKTSATTKIPLKNHKYGHIQIFSNKGWVSDKKQGSTFLPNQADYAGGTFTLWRHP